MLLTEPVTAKGINSTSTRSPSVIILYLVLSLQADHRACEASRTAVPLVDHGSQTG